MPATDAATSPLIVAAAGGLRVRLRVQPGARRDALDGIAADAEGLPVLKLRVTAPPEGGKANAAVIKVLAKAWGVPKGSLDIVSGAGGRNKTVSLSGDPGALLRRLRAWQAGMKIL